MLLNFQVGGQLAGGQQRPVDGAVAGIGGQVDGGFVAHAGAVLALGEQQYQQLLVPQIGVVQGWAAPGSKGCPLFQQARQGMGAGAGAELDRFEDGLQLLL